MSSSGQLAVAGIEADQFGENFFGQLHVARLRMGAGKFLLEFLVFGRILDQDLEGKNGGLREIGGQGGAGQELMARGAVGIGIKNLLGDFQSLQRLAAQGELPLGEQRGGGGAADHFFEKAAAAAFGLFLLADAEKLAAFKKRRLLLQDGGQNGDGVIVIVTIQRGLAFFKLFAQRPGDLTQSFLWHGADAYGQSAQKIQRNMTS